MKKLLLCVLALSMAAAMLFAGGGQQGSSGKIELNFLEVMTSPARTEVLNSMIAQYEALHPNVKINLISPPYEQADSKLTMMLNAQEALDIVEVRDLTASQYVTNRRLEDLTPYLEKWDEAGTLLSITTEAASSAGGRPYLIPQFFFIKALFVRNDILARYGVTKMPETLDELYDICKRITNPAQNQFGFTLRGKGSAFKTSDVMIISDIAGVDTEDFYKMKDGSSVYDNLQYLAALKKYIDLYEKGTPSDSINWGFNEQINAFVSGITPFLIQDPDTVPLLDEQLGRDKYTVIPMPAGRSGTIYLDYGFAGFGIPSYSKNKEAAWDFIAFMSSSEQNSEFCKKYGALPVHTTSFESDPYFNSGLYQAWAKTMNTPGRFTFIKYPYASEKFPGWGQVQEQYMQSALMGRTTPEAAVKAWADYWKN
ncbi:ABC transporter substrate-binding protein [Breznakiella homolactica]|uniref:Sugar ABC transporter substrate-binding protein n=1 Tax=Breznakiella homolactica TaxID=2798577 RepID=A0A7T8BAL3_9SPIR|nr:sugar ABC transporter substrate-binding protein [Breznakiella homolactica]QQO09486.1 sugar ABC transporter substrate-binding protein [Breznakiella homolactica]